MFGGAQGRSDRGRDAAADRRRRAMPAQTRERCVDMLQSVQQLLQQPTADAAAQRPRGITMPYTVNEEAMTAGANVAYNGYAHSFAGMAIQFLLFAMANMGDRDAARAAARALEAAAQRAGVAVDAARRQGGQRHADLADDAAGLVRVRDGRRSVCGSRAACSGSSASRSRAR